MAKIKSRFRDIIACLVLAGVTLAIFWPLTHAEFINYDDPRYVVENQHIHSGVNWNDVKWAFTTGYGSNWHPMTWISHMVDWQMYGLNPGKHHLTNIIFHVIDTLLLFGLMRFMTGTFWRSVFVAALFAWHPTHVESVAWVAERKDVLSTFFGLIAIWFYVDYSRRPKLWRYLLVAFFFTLSLLSKPMLVTLPCVLLLLDYWPLKRVGSRVDGKAVSWQKLFVEKIPLFALSAASCITTYYVQKAGGAMKAMHHLTMDAQVANAVVAYTRYLGKLFVPTHLAVFYPYNETLPDWQVLCAGLLLVGLTVLTFQQSKQRPYLIVGWLWFIGTLVPVIGLVQVGEASMADRYLYMPALGMFIAITWLAAETVSSWQATARRLALGTVGALALAGCVTCAQAQVGYWRDSATLFKHVLDVSPSDNEVGKYNMGVAEYNLGQALSQEGKIKDALPHYEAAVRYNPNDPKACNNLGLCLAMEGKYSEATNYYEKSLAAKSDSPDTHFNYALSLTALGDTGGAIRQYTESLKLEPNQPDAQNGIGTLYLQKRQFEEAREHLQEVIKLKPDYAEAHTSLGLVLSQLGRGQESVQEYREALRIKPNDLEALNNLCWIRATSPQAELRNGEEAVRLGLKASELTHDSEPVVLGTLAAAYAEAGRFDDAQMTAKKAIELAQASGQKPIAERNQQLLELYQSKKPYREAMASPGNSKK